MPASTAAPVVPGPSALADATGEAILDAARAAVLDFGVRRTTLTDVARRAHVSRMTVYKRYADVRALMRALMTRELGGLLERIAASASQADARNRLVAVLVRVFRELPAHPIFCKVSLAESELLVPYLTERLGATQRLGLALIERAVEEGQRDGSVRPGDPHAIAAAVLLVEQSFIVSAATVATVPAKRLTPELAHVLHGALAPGQETR